MNENIVAQRLVDLRNEKSQKEVAAAVGITVSALSMYETGNRIPRDEIKRKLAAYYNTTVQAIFFDN